MSISATQSILNLLPHYAEEGNIYTSVVVQDVIKNISKDAQVSKETAIATVALVQRLFDSLALLDRQQLQQGRWQFVSFPAQLLANSLLCVLADENQDLLDTHYWEQGGHRPEDVIEEQRNLLHTLERRRKSLHRQQSAAPIRFVYVAWGIIKLGGRFLLHHREDKARRKAGNWVFPGGRFNLTDLPPASQIAAMLPRLQCAASSEALANLRNTFIREMQEETGLSHTAHYDFRLWRSLKPYCEVEGSGNKHAYTEYMIQIYEVALTASGQIKLFDQLCKYPERFSWFELDDLIQKTTIDGKVAYIDALHEDLGDNLSAALEEVKEAFADCLLKQDETDALDIPFSSESSLLRGKTGKEKPIEVKLSDPECAALWGLACHAKQLEFSSVKDAVLLPCGWVKVLDEDVVKQLQVVAEKLSRAGLNLIESRDQLYFRLSATPNIIFLDESQFRYGYGAADAAKNKDCWFRLCLEPKDTPFGCVAGIDSKFAITRNTLRIIESIKNGDDPEADEKILSGDVQKIIRDQIDAHSKPLGLRKFVRFKGKEYEILIGMVLGADGSRT